MAHRRRTDTLDDIPPGSSITALKAGARTPGRVSIRVGRRAVATLDQRHVLDLGLHVGQAWTDELRARVEEAAQYDRARARCVNTLARRALSRRELMTRLERAGFDATVRERVAEDLQRMGLLDDEAYAGAVARDAVRTSPAGRRLVEMKLRRKGLDDETIARAADEAMAGRSEHEDALALARKRLARMDASLDERTRARRLYALLARRGFEASACRDAVEQALRLDQESPSPGDS